MKARDIMTTKVLAVQRDDQARHAVMIMADHDISGLPVVNDANELVGIVTESDLLMIDKAQPPRVKTALYGLWIEPDRMVEEDAQRRGVLVEDVMTRHVVTFGPDDSVAQIARTMADKRIKRVPILEGNKIVGIISRHDIIRALAEGKSLE
jgi:CBS domain-containing protein